jgi:hypothetical protein
LGDDFGVEGGAAGGDALECVLEFLDPGNAVFEQVADALGAVGQKFGGVGLLHVLGEYEHGQARDLSARLDGGLQALVPEAGGQPDIEDGGVGPVFEPPDQPAGTRRAPVRPGIRPVHP